MGRLRKFVKLTQDCVGVLDKYGSDVLGSYYGFPDDPKWEEWILAAYDEPGFLYDDDEGNYLDAYEKCANKKVTDLDKTTVRVWITFFMRKMRNHAISKAVFMQLLERWFELNND